jgi:EAL domain-containing protein (putative c-di-GMP-specific phosphodiesterase class I)
MRPRLRGALTTIDRHGRLPPDDLILSRSSHQREVEGRSARAASVVERGALGVSIAIDDFGTGYSSLRNIRRFPADVLKIAKPFVDGLHDETDTALVRTIVALADSLGLRTVAEGIEDHRQLARLRELGCLLGQGYLFARPLPAHDVTELLRGAGQLAA